MINTKKLPINLQDINNCRFFYLNKLLFIYYYESKNALKQIAIYIFVRSQLIKLVLKNNKFTLEQ